jgi:hypothetical protein
MQAYPARVQGRMCGSQLGVQYVWPMYTLHCEPPGQLTPQATMVQAPPGQLFMHIPPPAVTPGHWLSLVQGSPTEPLELPPEEPDEVEPPDDPEDAPVAPSDPESPSPAPPPLEEDELQPNMASARERPNAREAGLRMRAMLLQRGRNAIKERGEPSAAKTPREETRILKDS